MTQLKGKIDEILNKFCHPTPSSREFWRRAGDEVGKYVFERDGAEAAGADSGRGAVGGGCV